MAPPQCIGSARGFGSTTTRRCWRQCAGRAVCAAFTSSTLGSRPPPRSGSIDGGEGARGGVAGSEGCCLASGAPQEGEVLPASSHGRPGRETPPGGGGAGRWSRSPEKNPGPGSSWSSHRWPGRPRAGPPTSASALCVILSGPQTFLRGKGHDPRCADETLSLRDTELPAQGPVASEGARGSSCPGRGGKKI